MLKILHPDIRLALKNCNPKFQAIILLMSSSGMDSAEVRSLSYKQLLKSLQEYIKLPKNSMVSAYDLINLVDEKL